MRTISIDIEIDGDDEAAMEAIDHALDAGSIQEAIHNSCTEEHCAFDIEAVTCNYRDADVIAFLRQRIAASFSPDELTAVLTAIENGEHVPS